ncbi:hypothetical protein [Flavobacterium sp.]|uniref:hypothetical protein n=1 Tax=Flavobacterium sp. TaxID=239 RepID=UPI00286A68C3|nr:hypothetical protein [Flavobacterium sp.]
MIKKLLLLLFFICNYAFSQEEIPFSVRFQDYIQGDITFIANNIVNRKNANEAYNKVNDFSKLNDEFEMSYIDIDNDNSTFSSSSATIIPNKNAKELIFAGLYWSATYKSKIGHKISGIFLTEGDHENSINDIKIKIPSQSSYLDITGKVIFDGYENETNKKNAPYTCFYDLTDMVKSNPYGEYSVANIKATQGYLEGGVAGGWVIYFVYNDSTLTKKYITLYDGFAFIQRTIEINLSKFLTPKTGQINPKITLAALEGDLKLDGDNVRIKSAVNNRYFPIISNTRPVNNFFNSQITIENEPFVTRNPASLNTLGFDVSLLSFNNTKNKIITNNASQTQLKIATSGDKFYLFAAGFSTEVDEVFFDIMKKEQRAEKEKNVSMNREEKNETIVRENKTPTNEGFILKRERITERMPISLRKLNVKNTDLKYGYYIVSNVFANESNKIKYIDFLKKHQIESNSFTNLENNFYYVYLKYFENLEDTQKAYDSNLDNTFFDDYWILQVD